MFSKLTEVQQKFQILNDKMLDPAVHSNQAEYQKITKEIASLRPLIENFELYQKKTKELEGNKQILQTESDAELREMAKMEITQLEEDIEKLSQQLTIQLLPKDPNDDKNIYIEIRAGAGGDEASLFAAELFRMYQRYAEAQGWRVELMSTSESEAGGYKEIIAMITGDRVYSKLKYESGGHRVQRVPKTEAQGRIHTSTVTVAVMPEAEDVEIHIPETDLKIDVMRAGGAGGQHVNKTESAVRITHLPTGLVVLCRDDRSQHKNRAQAMKVLKARLYDMKLNEQKDAEAKIRKDQVGTGDRSEKIRTYNFPQGRITDHRIGLTIYQVDTVMDGKLDLVLEPLHAHFQAEALKNSSPA